MAGMYPCMFCYGHMSLTCIWGGCVCVWGVGVDVDKIELDAERDMHMHPAVRSERHRHAP